MSTMQFDGKDVEVEESDLAPGLGRLLHVNKGSASVSFFASPNADELPHAYSVPFIGLVACRSSGTCTTMDWSKPSRLTTTPTDLDSSHCSLHRPYRSRKCCDLYSEGISAVHRPSELSKVQRIVNRAARRCHRAASGSRTVTGA